MKVRHVLIIVSTILLLVFIWMVYMMGFGSGVGYGVQNAEKTREEQKAKSGGGSDSVEYKTVVADLITNDTVQAVIKGYGRVVSTSAINVSSEVQGKIVSAITLKKGIHFKAGQTLFTLNNSDAILALKARKSNFLTLLNSMLPDMKVDFPDNFQAWNKFYNEIRVNEPLPYMPDFKSEREKNFVVSRNILSEFYNIKSDEEKLKKYSVSAPFDGSIIDAFSDVGAIVNPGAAVLSVIRDNTMEIEIPIASEKVEQVKIGASVNLVDHNHKSYNGKIIRIGDYINQNTQTVPVFVSITSSTDDLYNGMYLDASINGVGFENVVEIPRKSLIRNNEVYTVASDSSLTPMSVKVLSYKENSVVVSGIPNNTYVVTESVISSKEGEKVLIAK